MSIRGSDLSQVARHGRISSRICLPKLTTYGDACGSRRNGYALDDVEATIADITIVKVDGRVGPPPGLIGTDLRVRVDGSDLSKDRCHGRGGRSSPRDVLASRTRAGAWMGVMHSRVSSRRVGSHIEIDAEGLVGEPPRSSAERRSVFGSAGPICRTLEGVR